MYAQYNKFQGLFLFVFVYAMSCLLDMYYIRHYIIIDMIMPLPLRSFAEQKLHKVDLRCSGQLV